MTNQRALELNDLNEEPRSSGSSSSFSLKQIPKLWIAVAVIFYVASVVTVGLLAGLLPNRTEHVSIIGTTSVQPSTINFTQQTTDITQLSTTTPIIIPTATTTTAISSVPTAPTTQTTKITSPSSSTTPGPSACIDDECNPRLSTDVIVHGYEVIYQINAMNQTLIQGKVTIRFRLKQPLKQIIYHAKEMIFLETPSLSEDGVDRLVSMRFYGPNDYVSLTPIQSEFFASNDYELVQTFVISVTSRSTGFYRTDFTDDDKMNKTIFSTRFKPADARRAFPCFDEPQLKAKFKLTLLHPQNTVAISNSLMAEETNVGDLIQTEFSRTFLMSTYLNAWAILPDSFGEQVNQPDAYTFNIWTRAEPIEKNQTDLALDTIEMAVTNLRSFFGVDEPLPQTINMLAIPGSAVSESENWGLAILREDRLIFNRETSSALDEQTLMEVIIRVLTHYWIGNFVGIEDWKDQWFVEATARWYALHLIQVTSRDWNIEAQYVPNFMVPAMWYDSKPTSHPLSMMNVSTYDEINRIFDPIMLLKGTSLIRMLENLVGLPNLEDAFQNYVDNFGNDIGSLTEFYNYLPLSSKSSEYMQTWTEEANYPLVTVRLNVDNDHTIIDFSQSRFIILNTLNTSGLDENHRWKIDMECILGGKYPDDDVADLGSQVITVQLNNQSQSVTIDGKSYSWIKCNKDFKVMYVTDYHFPTTTWSRFTNVIQAEAETFSDGDQSNLIQDAFLLAFKGLLNYTEPLRLVRSTFDVIPYKYAQWKTFLWHWENLAHLIDYFPDILPHFQNFAIDRILSRGQSVDFFAQVYPIEGHESSLVKSSLFEFLCRMNNSDAISKVQTLFQSIPTEYFDGENVLNPVPVDILSSVYTYYMKSTNNENDWYRLYFYYGNTKSPQERIRVLRAICSTENPQLLEALLNNTFLVDQVYVSQIKIEDHFLLFEYMSAHPVGRSVAWKFYQNNYLKLATRSSSESHRFSSLILTLSRSFENELYLQQMKDLFEKVSNVYMSSKVQEQAIEQVQLNLDWIEYRLTSLRLALGQNEFQSK